MIIETPLNIGQIIYVTDHYAAKSSKTGYVGFAIEDIRYSPVCHSNCKNCANWFCINNRNTNDKSGEIKCELRFVYDVYCADCFETFTVNDIGKTVFLTEEEAKKAAESK